MTGAVSIEEHFVQFADLRPEALLLVTGTGQVAAANRRVADRLGVAPGELVGRPLADFAAEPPAEVERYLRACARTREPVLGALTWRRPGGEPQALRAEGAALRPRGEGEEALILLALTPREDAAGRFIALTRQIDSLAREVARRRRAEEDLGRQRAWLEVTLGSIGDAVLATDGAGRVVFMNPAAEALTVWPRAEALGRPLDEVFTLFHEQTGRPAEGPAGRALREGTVVGLGGHTVLRGRDGSERPVEDCAAPIREPDGRVAGVVLVFHDASAKRRAERALAEREDRLRLAVEAAEMGTWDFDPVSGRLQWSERCKAIFGLPADAEVSYPVFLGLLHPEDRARTDEAVRRALDPARPQGFDAEYRVVWPDGLVRWVRAKGRAFFAGAGPGARAVRFLGTVLDVTDRKYAEEALQEADRRKDQFLAMLAHELRNPLGPVLNAVHLLQHHGDDAGTRATAVDILVRQVRHLGRLVDGLLEATRVVRGGIELRRERLDLARLVRTTAEDRRPALAQAGLALAVRTPQTPVWVRGDATRLAQALQNLLDNAGRFTDAGGRVEVGLDADAGRREAVLSVRDTGVGIEPEMLPRLFDVFAQADRSLARSRGGLGLGLTVVRGLVELHGGRVAAASAGPGRGAEFTVRLPLEDEPPALAPAPAPAPPAAAPLHVLVIEDHRDAADTLRLFLEMLGHEVRVAHTGTAGVREAAAWQPDAVISDIGLPGLDGYGVAAQLRADPATARTLLIGVSGYGSAADIRRALESGFDHYLVKPAMPEDIQGLLAQRQRKGA
jgi:PAS domain S-box-containing protein